MAASADQSARDSKASASEVSKSFAAALPRTFATANGGLPPKMQLVFWICLIAVATLWYTLVRFELTAKRTRGELSRLRRALDGNPPPSGTAARIAPGAAGH